MKRMLSCILVMVLLLSVIPVCGSAAEADMILYQDGGYAVIEITSLGSRASGTVTGSKTYTYYDSDDVAQWKAILTGKFTYTGSASTCTSSSVSTTIYDSTWYAVSKSASKSGNTATAYVKMGDAPDGVTVIIVPVSLTLSCDANGNLS